MAYSPHRLELDIDLEDTIHTNDNESYRPFIAEEFVQRDVAPAGEGPNAG